MQAEIALDRVEYQTQTEKKKTHTMLLAAAKLMTQEVGTSALGEVWPEGHWIDIGVWSFGRRSIRNFIL